MRTSTLLLTVLGGGAGVVAPSAPTNLAASPSSVSQIDLTWTDNATNEDGYKIYRSTDNVSFSEIDDIAAGSTSYSDTTIAAGVGYYYEPRPYNSAGETRPAASVAASTLTLGLALWYRMDESSWAGVANEIVDSSGNGRHGVAGNGANTTASGKFNRGGDFTGASSHYAKSGAVSIAIGSAFVFAAWLKAAVSGSQPTTTNMIFGVDNAGNGLRAFQYRLNSGNLELIRFNTSNAVIETVACSPAVDLRDNAWHHVVAVFDTTNGTRLYVDGVQKGTSSTTTANQAITTAEPVMLMARASTGVTNFTTGVMDDPRIYTRTMDATEVGNFASYTPPL